MGERYAEKTRQLCCFRGIAEHTALSVLVEIGDFSRFPTAQHFASFLGLTPSEHSSGESQHNGAITKAGNSHLRRLLIESANHYNRGAAGKKSSALKKRQDGNKPVNIAKTAVARELTCFIWEMMTGHIA